MIIPPTHHPRPVPRSPSDWLTTALDDRTLRKIIGYLCADDLRTMLRFGTVCKRARALTHNQSWFKVPTSVGRRLCVSVSAWHSGCARMPGDAPSLAHPVLGCNLFPPPSLIVISIRFACFCRR